MQCNSSHQHYQKFLYKQRLSICLVEFGVCLNRVRKYYIKLQCTHAHIHTHTHTHTHTHIHTHVRTHKHTEIVTVRPKFRGACVAACM